MENSEILSVCGFNAVWQVVRQSNYLRLALAVTKWEELRVLLDKSQNQDGMYLDQVKNSDDAITIPPENLVNAAEVCEKFFGHLLAKGENVVEQQVDAREVFSTFIGKLSKSAEESLCSGQFSIALPGGDHFFLPTEAFTKLCLAHPSTTSSMQQVVKDWSCHKIDNSESRIARTFTKLPDVLLVSLVRKDATANDGLTRQQVDSLELQNKAYRLVGLLQHKDNHWTAVLPDEKQGWIFYDDDRIGSIEAVAEHVAMICYEKLKSS